MWYAINSFNAGELSPKMLARTDVSQYFRGCRTLQNFMVTPYGSVEKRPGTRYIATAAMTGEIRLLRFAASKQAAYLLEFGSGTLRFYRHGQPVNTASGYPLQLTTPYLQDLHLLKTVQSADVMTICHPNYPVMELLRVGESEFELREKAFEYPPMRDPNDDDNLVITPAGENLNSGEVTLNSSAELWSAGHIGSFWQIVHTRKSGEIKTDFTKDGETEALTVFGFWSFTTHGTWSGRLSIQRSFDSGKSWSNYRTFSSSKDANFTETGTESTEGVLYRLKMEDYAASDTGTLKLCRTLLVNPDFVSYGVVKLTSFIDAKTVKGEIVRKLGAFAPTSEWNEGAWSNVRGYPGCVAFFGERMFFANTRSAPQTLWGSKVHDWDNFLLSSAADSGLSFTLASDTVNEVLWLCGQKNLLFIGTGDSEWSLSASEYGSAVTPDNFLLQRQSVFGSYNLTGALVGDTVLFVQQGQKKIRELVFDQTSESFKCPDMTILADHIAGPGFKEIALQQLPDSLLWCLKSDGTAAVLTYERDQEVVGWQNISTSGEILSLAVLPGTVDNRVYWAVKRNGQIYIEEVASRRSELSAMWYLDSAVEKFGDNLTTLGNLHHLEGMEVYAVGDNALLGTFEVVDGRIAWDEGVSRVLVGLNYPSVLVPMPLEAELQDGRSMLRRKSVSGLKLMVYDSVGGAVVCRGDQQQQFFSRSLLFDKMDLAQSLKSEVWNINFLSGFVDSVEVEISQNKPLPLNVSSAVLKYEVTE